MSALHADPTHPQGSCGWASRVASNPTVLIVASSMDCFGIYLYPMHGVAGQQNTCGSYLNPRMLPIQHQHQSTLINNSTELAPDRAQMQTYRPS